ncbi:hypothetical protein [Hydrogenophaga sp.]|uniref:hypothetical protein n=1 Tax=Hydrogenophaga sp. TaxID=1904254 RepID=UPI003F6ABF88
MMNSFLIDYQECRLKDFFNRQMKYGHPWALATCEKSMRWLDLLIEPIGPLPAPGMALASLRRARWSALHGGACPGGAYPVGARHNGTAHAGKQAAPPVAKHRGLSAVIGAVWRNQQIRHKQTNFWRLQ